MAAFLDDKAELDISSVTNINSLFIYLRDNGNDRKVTGAAIQSFLGQDGLPTKVVLSSADLVAPRDTVTTVTFDTARQNPYGMFNPSTPSILTVPFNGMVMAEYRIYWRDQGTSGATFTYHDNLFYKNGELVIGGQGSGGRLVFRPTSEYNGSMPFFTAPFSVTSGDVLALTGSYLGNSASMSTSLDGTYLTVYPLSAFR